MRDFFKQELKTLKAKTGLNQYETFSSMPDAEVQLKALLDGMVSVCSGFNYIPDDHKKEIIKAAIITDPDFTGLYARVVFKWLQAKNNLYFKEEAHQKEKSVYDKVQLTEDQRTEVDKLLDDYKQEIIGGFGRVPELTTDEIENEGQERPKKIEVHKPDQEFLKMMALIRKTAYAKYIGTDYSKFRNYIVEGYKIFCASQSDAHEIYIEALTLNE